MKLAIFSSICVCLLLANQSANAENLLQVYQRAKQYDAQLKAQESLHLANLEQGKQVRANLKPQATLSTDTAYTLERDTNSHQTNNGVQVNYALALAQPLYNPKLKATIAQVDAQSSQSNETLEAARQDLILRVASAYFAALQAQDNVTLAQAEQKAISHQLQQAQAYFDAGRSAITDVKEAEASHAAVQTQVITATQQLDIAQEQLRVLTGVSYSQIDAPHANMPLSIPEPITIDAWVNLAKQNNHTIHATQQALNAARQGVNVQRATKQPNVELFAKQTASYLDSGVYNHQRTQDIAVGVSLSMPLYTGGATTSKIREAQFNLQQAQQIHTLQTNQTEQQTRSAFLSVQSSISQIAANKQALTSAETALQATRAGFEVGTRTSVDVLNAVRSEFRARRDYANARYTYLLNTLQLRQAAGTLNDKDITTISEFM